MKITEFLDKKGIKIGLNKSEKEDVLKELVDVLANVKDVGDRKSIVQALIERENLGSTGIGQGIAIPHGKTDRVDGLVGVLGISQRGVNFESLDGEQVLPGVNVFVSWCKFYYEQWAFLFLKCCLPGCWQSE